MSGRRTETGSLEQNIRCVDLGAALLVINFYRALRLIFSEREERVVTGV
jgi:hypothetical protein